MFHSYTWWWLTFDFDDMRLVTGRVRGGHDGERGHVADGAHGGHALPRRAEQPAHGVHRRHDHDVHVEPAALLQFPLRLINDQPASDPTRNHIYLFIGVNVHVQHHLVSPCNGILNCLTLIVYLCIYREYKDSIGLSS